MAIYQFMIAVRSAEQGGASVQLTNEDGEVTSHIQGMFSRTIRLLARGLKPCYVFDGKPPTLKGGELAKRGAKREQAEKDLKAAEEEGNAEDVDKFSKRLVRVTRENNEDCKELLRLMGVPVVTAPCEAEAQCAALAAAGKVYATGTEDMDALTFRTPVLLRRLTMPEAKKMPILEISVEKVLTGLDIDYDMFVDLCIMMGCDYTDSIKGIGPKTALKLIREHKNIETILQKIDQKKFEVPAPWLTEEPIFLEARRLFKQHEVSDPETVELKWTDCNEPELTKFLVEKFGFNPDRVASGIAKLKKTRGTASQARMDSFFKSCDAPSDDKMAAKRKAAQAAKSKGGNKKAKTGPSKFGRRK
jgi:flap endonuclease-1